MLSIWELQRLDLAIFLWNLKSVVLKPKQNISCILLTSEFVSVFLLVINL